MRVGLSDCLTLMGLGLSALAAALLGGQRFGWPGAAAGLILGPVAYAVVVVVLLGAQDLLERKWPPPCHEGRCRGSFWHGPGTYEIVVVQDVADRAFHILHRCRCGHAYEEVGRRFMERLPNGTLRPYMIYRPYRGWFPDPGQVPTDDGPDRP
ncbi:hypothetical protein LLH23_10235 [bacterium]|nr:hypothetical protein [bacterium]